MSLETEDKSKVEDSTENKEQKTSTGLDENIAGLLCYAFTFVTGIIFLVLEKENEFVKFHAMQSIFTFVALFIIGAILTIIPILGLLISILLVPIFLILWIFLMYKAYNGEKYKLPFVGD